jgi:hypothetical protein
VENAKEDLDFLGKPSHRFGDDGAAGTAVHLLEQRALRASDGWYCCWQVPRSRRDASSDSHRRTTFVIRRSPLVPSRCRRAVGLTIRLRRRPLEALAHGQHGQRRLDRLSAARDGL